MRFQLFLRGGWVLALIMIGQTYLGGREAWGQWRTTILPSVSVSQDYNDNVSFSARDREDEFITRFQPRVDVSIGSRRTDLDVGYQLGYELLAKRTRESRDFHNFSLGLSSRISPRLSLFANDSFSLTPTTAAAAQVDLPDIQVGRTISTTNSLVLGASYLFTPRTSGDFTVRHSMTRFQAGNLIDSDSFGLQAGVSHTRSPKMTITGGFGAGFVSSEGRPETLSFNFRFGGTQVITRTITISGTTGLNFTTSPVSDNVGLSSGLFVSKALPRGGLNFSFDRDVTSGGGARGAVTASRLGVGFAYALTRTVNTNANFSVSLSSSRVGEGGDIMSIRAGMGLDKILSRYLVLRGTYSFSLQDVDLPGARQTVNNRFAIILTAAFPPLN